ncbi:MAG TPA: disulfide bond formation protein DsbA [Gammaproteobacteria bacterium]|nr:disulfide bond formation protein DsbA [Gammaproteobacteria bacterium]|tara:strand:- start:410 stop:1018 length:609 start_codon:yes stop_codon:yes gene_type:complete
MRLEFHFDFGSPNTYYCHRVLPEIEARTGAKFDYVPILLGGIFKATNNKSPMEALAGIKNKSEYNALETARFVSRHRLNNFKFNPNFPVNTLHIMRGAVYAIKSGLGERYIEAMYQCMWEKELNMSDPEVIASALNDANLPGQDIIAGAASPEIKQELIDNTMASVGRGSFGSPTFYVGDELYFGKDKLAEVETEIIYQTNG